ncbi:AI-2E family transporter [Brevibacillus daliensis]|uniref:AI-2E family transporter n=1 Tax=Brevibacillus daliensis TaxID=2892995 RepID=UPI001E609017|nr:AI-2E family transporter [Brevibacillus daliensis]
MDEKNKYFSSKLVRFFLNQRLVTLLLILLLVGLNIYVFNHISYIFNPFTVLLATVSLPLLLAGVAYYLLNPIVDFLEKRKIKRLYAILLLYLVIIGLITILVVAIIPVVKDQIISLMDNMPGYISKVQAIIEKWVGSDLFLQVQHSLNFNMTDIINDLAAKASEIANNTFRGIGTFVGAVTNVILALVIVPFILFYLLKDGKKLPQYIVNFVPTDLRGRSANVLSEMNGQISSYIRGQIVVSFIIGLLLYIGYLIIGLEYSIVLAIIASLTSIVPYLGPAIAITPALIIAMVTSPIMLVKMIVVWTVVQFIEGKFISPQIMGKSLRIHPITIIFVILTAGNLFGVVGIILAIPGYAVLKVIATHLFNWFKTQSGLYTESATETDQMKNH